MAQPAKHLTLGFGSGHDLTVCEFESHVGLYADSAEPAWDSVSLSLPLSLSKYADSVEPAWDSVSLSASLSLSLSQNK